LAVAWLTDDITHPVVAYLNLGISFIALGKRQQAIEILQAGSNLDGAAQGICVPLQKLCAFRDACTGRKERGCFMMDILAAKGFK